MTTYKPKTHCEIVVPLVGQSIGDEDGSVMLQPQVVEATLTRNPYNEADELSLVLDWRDAGVDPRMLSNAVVAFWMWDENYEDFSRDRHLRFLGIATRPARKLSEGAMHVEIPFQDYTSLFIASKPFPVEGVPDWGDTLQSAWERICDHTGFWDVAQGKMVSSVSKLRDKLVFRLSDPSRADRPLGDAVPQRFHAFGKPQPPNGSDSWGVWIYCCALLGLITYVDRGEVIVSDTTEHWSEEHSPSLIWGRNILSLEEHHDTAVAAKGILLRSFDPLNGHLLESLYPPPGDPRIRARRATVRKQGEPTFDDLASQYEVQNSPWIIDQKMLDLRCKEAWEERRRQELQGSLSLSEMRIGHTDDPLDILDLAAGDSIKVEVDVDSELLGRLESDTARVDYLVHRVGYDLDVAWLIVRNMARTVQPIFHVRTLQVRLTPQSFDVKIDYMSKIQLEGRV